MKNKLIPSLVLAASVLISSCDKSDNEAKPMVAGKGGGITLQVTPQHHGRNIDGCTVYLKYNATDLPSSFDDSAVCMPVAGRPVATFSDLKQGNYYVSGKGWDPNIAEAVTGGVSYTLLVTPVGKETQITIKVFRTDDQGMRFVDSTITVIRYAQPSGAILNINLPVSEGD